MIRLTHFYNLNRDERVRVSHLRHIMLSVTTNASMVEKFKPINSSEEQIHLRK